MLRWLVVIFIVLILFASALPSLEKWGLGRLPGDLNFTFMGRKISLPFMSSILLCSIIFIAGRWLR